MYMNHAHSEHQHWLECIGRLERTGMTCARDCLAGCSSRVNSVVHEPSMENGVRAAAAAPMFKIYFYVVFISKHRTELEPAIIFSADFFSPINSYVGTLGVTNWDVMLFELRFFFFPVHFPVRYSSSLFTGTALLMTMPFFSCVEFFRMSVIRLVHYHVVLVNMWMTWIVKVDSLLLVFIYK